MPSVNVYNVFSLPAFIKAIQLVIGFTCFGILHYYAFDTVALPGSEYIKVFKIRGEGFYLLLVSFSWSFTTFLLLIAYTFDYDHTEKPVFESVFNPTGALNYFMASVSFFTTLVKYPIDGETPALLWVAAIVRRGILIIIQTAAIMLKQSTAAIMPSPNVKNLQSLPGILNVIQFVIGVICCGILLYCSITTTEDSAYLYQRVQTFCLLLVSFFCLLITSLLLFESIFGAENLEKTVCEMLCQLVGTILYSTSSGFFVALLVKVSWKLEIGVSPWVAAVCGLLNSVSYFVSSVVAYRHRGSERTYGTEEYKSLPSKGFPNFRY